MTQDRTGFSSTSPFVTPESTLCALSATFWETALKCKAPLEIGMVCNLFLWLLFVYLSSRQQKPFPCCEKSVHLPILNETKISF